MIFHSATHVSAATLQAATHGTHHVLMGDCTPTTILGRETALKYQRRGQVHRQELACVVGFVWSPEGPTRPTLQTLGRIYEFTAHIRIGVVDRLKPHSVVLLLFFFWWSAAVRKCGLSGVCARLALTCVGMVD